MGLYSTQPDMAFCRINGAVIMGKVHFCMYNDGNIDSLEYYYCINNKGVTLFVKLVLDDCSWFVRV